MTIIMTGGAQSLKEGIEESMNGPKVFDTDIIENSFAVRDPTSYSEDGDFFWDKNSRQSTSRSYSLEELEQQSKESSGR